MIRQQIIYFVFFFEECPKLARFIVIPVYICRWTDKSKYLIIGEDWPSDVVKMSTSIKIINYCSFDKIIQYFALYTKKHLLHLHVDNHDTQGIHRHELQDILFSDVQSGGQPFIPLQVQGS